MSNESDRVGVATSEVGPRKKSPVVGAPVWLRTITSYLAQGGSRNVERDRECRWWTAWQVLLVERGSMCMALFTKMMSRRKDGGSVEIATR